MSSVSFLSIFLYFTMIQGTYQQQSYGERSPSPFLPTSAHPQPLQGVSDPGARIIWEQTFNQTITAFYSTALYLPSLHMLIIGTETSTVYAMDSVTGTVIWSTPVGGNVRSTPCVYQDQVIFGANDYNIYNLNLNNGSINWKYTTAGAIGTSSPTVNPDDGTIYIGSSDKYVYALQNNGTLLWRYRTGGSIESSPTLSPDYSLLYIGSNDYLLWCLNAFTGQLVWYYPKSIVNGAAVRGTPVYVANVSSTLNSTIFIGNDVGTIFAVDAYSGNPIYNDIQGLITGAITSRPALFTCLSNPLASLLYFTSADGSLYNLGVQTGVVQRNFSTNGPISTSPALSYTTDNNNTQLTTPTVYITSQDGYLYAIQNTNTWKYEVLPSGFPIYSSPIVGTPIDPYSTTIYFGTYGGSRFLAIGHILNSWYFSVPTTITSSPILVSSNPSSIASSVYLGIFQTIDGNLYCINATTGILTWFRSFPGFRLNYAPLLTTSNLLVFAANSYLYTINPITGNLVFQTSSVAVSCSPQLLLDGSIAVCASIYIYTYVPNSGTVNWYGPLNYGPLVPFLSLTVSPSGIMYAPAADGYLYAIVTLSSQPLWKVYGQGNLTNAVAGPDDTVYFGSDSYSLPTYPGQMFAINKQGSSLWNQYLSATPLTVSTYGPLGYLYVGTNLSVIALDALNNGFVQWTYYVDSPITAPPVVDADNNVYVGSVGGIVYSFNGRNGTLNWYYNTYGTISYSPTILLNTIGMIRQKKQQEYHKQRLLATEKGNLRTTSTGSPTNNSDDSFPPSQLSASSVAFGDSNSGTLSVLTSSSTYLFSLASIPSAGPTPSSSPTPSSTQSFSATATASSSATSSATSTGSSSATATATATTSATRSSQATSSASASASASASYSPTASFTPTPTPTPSMTPLSQANSATVEKWTLVGVGSGVGLALVGAFLFVVLTGKITVPFISQAIGIRPSSSTASSSSNSSSSSDHHDHDDGDGSNFVTERVSLLSTADNSSSTGTRGSKTWFNKATNGDTSTMTNTVTRTAYTPVTLSTTTASSTVPGRNSVSNIGGTNSSTTTVRTEYRPLDD